MRIHEDLKSNNILLDKDWVAKVADYGQNSIKDLARTVTSVGNVAWTGNNFRLPRNIFLTSLQLPSFCRDMLLRQRFQSTRLELFCGNCTRGNFHTQKNTQFELWRRFLADIVLKCPRTVLLHTKQYVSRI